MPLRVYYKNRIGYCTQVDKYDDMPTRKFRIWFCRANALCAMMYFYRKKDENGKNSRVAQLCGFFSDLEHAKRCIKDGMFSNYTNFHFIAKNMDAAHWSLVKALVKNGIKVTIE